MSVIIPKTITWAQPRPVPAGTACPTPGKDETFPNPDLAGEIAGRVFVDPPNGHAPATTYCLPGGDFKALRIDAYELAEIFFARGELSAAEAPSFIAGDVRAAHCVPAGAVRKVVSEDVHAADVVVACAAESSERCADDMDYLIAYSSPFVVHRRRLVKKKKKRSWRKERTLGFGWKERRGDGDGLR